MLRLILPTFILFALLISGPAAREQIGAQKEKRAIARTLLVQGIDLAVIAAATGLSAEEITALARA